MMVDQYQELVSAMQSAARRAYEIRLQSGDGGNLSVRIPGKDQLLIKASGACFGNLGDDRFVLASFQGELLAGFGRPSRELRTHIRIYQQRPDVQAVFHCHSPWAVSCAQVFGEIPPVSLPLQTKVGFVPVLDADLSHADDAAASAVGRFLDEHPAVRVFVQRRHGMFCMAQDIIKAEHDAELVEEAAQVALVSAIAGGSIPVS